MNGFTESLGQLGMTEYLYIGASVLVLLFIVILLLRRQPSNVLAYTTENGRVMVSRSAIVELVQTSCEQLEDVSKPQVNIEVKGGNTHFEVRLKLASGGRLRAIEETLQTHLRQALTENLGIENLGRINIVATGFKSGRVDQTKSSSINQRGASEESVEENVAVTILEDGPDASSKSI